MNIVVDDGNSRTKVAIFREGDETLEAKVFQSADELKKYLQGTSFANALVSSVRGRANEILSWIDAGGRKIPLSANIPLPLTIRYLTPATLGVDRIAAAAGAIQLFPKTNCLVIDAGTCITFEFVSDRGEYLGGAISPGIRMRFEAMHQLTARLPLAMPSENAPLIGSGTVECLQSGVMNGVTEEIKGIIRRYESEFNNLRVILCGGDAGFFENTGKPSIFVAPNLVLYGLKGILTYNVSS
jgi:type III pantothenate kinase